MSSTTLTPGPDSVEKVIWSRRSDGNRLFDLPCSGIKLASRDGQRDTKPPYTCGTYARRAVIKHYLRDKFGGMQNSEETRKMVVKVVNEMINRTRAAWELDANYQCRCNDGIRVGWGCCTEQSQCSTNPCTCPAGFEVVASVACCNNVCAGLAGNGLMEPFSYINGSDIALDLLKGLGGYMQNDIWTTTDPWLKYDPNGAAAYKSSWEAAKFEVTDAGLFDASSPVVTYEEMNYPFKNSMWKHCTGLMQQVMWTLPVDSSTKRPRMPSTEYDPLSKTSNTVNLTYTEEFIQTITLQSYKSSPLYWHYNVRYVPTDSEVCLRDTPRKPEQGAFFTVGNRKAAKMGFSSMTLGGLGGADCFCGWWNQTGDVCRIPDAVCQSLVQIVGFLRVCNDQKQIYNSSDHTAVLRALEILLKRQSNTVLPCPSLQVSEHWGFLETDGSPLANSTRDILTEGVGGFRKGNTEWLFDAQTGIINFKTRVLPIESSTGSAALQCTAEQNPNIANHFIDDLFPAAQGVRQSMPQTYCTRYGIELARLTVYKAAGLASATGQQQGVADKWKTRCQYKLEELAVCNLHKVAQAYNDTHKSTDHCPFTMYSDFNSNPLYSVTPGCLLVIWKTEGGALDGIYDPCVCLAMSVPPQRTCAGILDTENNFYSRPSFKIAVDILQSCKLQGLNSLVGESVIPGESNHGVPLGSGSFENLMSKDQRAFKVNTQEADTHWTKHNQIWDADFLQDWWPDAWRYPSGYHVTPGCSRMNDYHWKTFDSSWRWDLFLKRMVFSKEETNDALQRHNAFGASGVCRTNNYGMPMTGLNTMTTCTKENANANADPMVPSPAQQTAAAWVDGQEHCAPDSASTPWKVDKTVNPPRQWTVGTLQQESGGLQPVDVTEWGAGCGPYPVRTCRFDMDCATGLKCMKSMTASVGVCSKSGNGIFDCIEHSHCTNNKMCAGDGRCVDGVWKVANKIGKGVSFRTHSQQCGTGTSLNTWGTSVAENVPDILKSSGLCSFRSWYENRKMAEANTCSSQGSCQNFRGVFPWNFTDHRSPNSAFDDEVLKVKAHPCDREYQYYEGFVACSPQDVDVEFYDANGQTQVKPGPPGLPTDTRTRTYRPDKTLPLVSLTQGQITRGFTGIPQTYNELNLGKEESKIKPCSQVNICGLQPDFRVNGKVVMRMVVDNGVVREYGVLDMIKCGSFGYIASGSAGVCSLDYAVVPLAYVYIKNPSLFRGWGITLTESYTNGNMATVFDALSKLPAKFLTSHIGPAPDTLEKYMEGSDKFDALHKMVTGISAKPVYEESGIPKQIYYLAKWAAYEVPFSWWYRCCWLAEKTMGVYEIDTDQCPYVSDPGSQTTPPSIVFLPYDTRLTFLLNVASPDSIMMSTATLSSILQRLPGVLSRDTFNSIANEYTAKRTYWLEKIRSILQNIIKQCYSRKEYVSEYAALSEEYQLAWIQNYLLGRGFSQTDDKMYKDANNQTVCTGKQCTVSVDKVMSSFSSTSGFADTLIGYFANTPVSVSSAASLGASASVLNNKYVFIPSLASLGDVNYGAWNALGDMFENNPSGCEYIVTATTTPQPAQYCVCNSWEKCSAKLQNQITQKSSIPLPLPDEDAVVNLGGMGNIEVCCGNFPPPSTPDNEKCYLDPNQLVSGGNFSRLTDIKVPIGVTLEAFQQEPWECAYVSCQNSSHQYNNKFMPLTDAIAYNTNTEKVIMKEVSYFQITHNGKTLEWENQATETSELNTYNLTKNPNTPRWVGIGENTYCMPSTKKGTNPDRHMPIREISKGLEFKLSVYVFEYYVNGTKVGELETFPCAEDIDVDKSNPVNAVLLNLIEFESITRGTPFSAKQRDLWPEAVQKMAKFNKYRSFQQQEGKICNKTGLRGQFPEAGSLFDNLTPRSFTPVAGIAEKFGIKTKQDLATRIKSVISTIHTAIPSTEDDCFGNICSFDDNLNKRGSVHVIYTFDADSNKMQDFCIGKKADSLYGCAMFPGEAVTKESCCIRYKEKAWSLEVVTCDNPNDPHPCTWSQYHRCLMSVESDKCYDSYIDRDKNAIDKIYRNMRPESRTIQYVLITTAPDCTYGPTRWCKLTEEPSAVQNQPLKGFCPNYEKSTAERTKLYRQMKLVFPPKINTNIESLFSLPDLEGNTEYSFGGGDVKADHLFLSLNKGYTCSVGTPISTTCKENEFPIQIRRNLWHCGKCPLVSQTYCTGQHNCLMDSPAIAVENLNTLSGWDTELSAQERAFLTGTSATIDIATTASKWLVGQLMQLAMQGIGMSYTVPEFMRTYTESDFTYSPLSILAHSSAMDSRVSTCTKSGISPVFTNCSYDGNKRKLRTFVNSTGGGYKVQEGMLIPGDWTMAWRLWKSQLVTQNIPMWLATGNKSGMFWRDLFDDKWCKKGNMQDNACYITSDTNNRFIEVLNPGLLGDFEPLEGCDTKIVNGLRVVNAMCSICAEPTTMLDVVDLLKTEDSPMSCANKYKTVSGVTSNLDADSNLCGKSPTYDSTCSNLQGMLGQTTYDGNPVQNVYTRTPWSGGKLAIGIKENPLFRGKSPGDVTSNLALKLTDIGGHCVGMEIKFTGTDLPTMSIVQLPLSSYTTLGEAFRAVDSTNLKWMDINEAKETDALKSIYPNSVCSTWDCPLRRRAFYVGKHDKFRPYTPDPLRTQILFGTTVHPTQAATPLIKLVSGTSSTNTLGAYLTSNGFCACTTMPCSSCQSDEDALTGNWQNATAASAGCTNQIDWPYPPGKLRDGSNYPSNMGGSSCGILDRLPMFKYRYVNTKRITPSTKTTLDKGGVCHMGWPITTKIPTGCYILPDDEHPNKYDCPGSGQNLEGGTLNRLTAKTLDQLLSNRLRPRLVDCDAAPKYVTSDETEVKPEVSYGMLKRLETSRMLAIDLRRKLCGNSSKCTPSENWELSSFWEEVYMKKFPEVPGGNGANQSLWENPWVVCKQHTENNTQTCEGTIDRGTWITGNRTEVCLLAIQNTTLKDELSQPVNVCDLDPDMDFFCRSVQDARYKVFEANCIFSGQCRQKLFFYQPSTYSIDNAQFVRSTVRQFYDSTVSGACVPDQDTAAAIRANAENLKNCAALTLTTLADCLQIVRVIMDSLVEIVFYVGNLFLYVFQMLAVNDRPELRSQIIQQINAILLHIKNSFLQLFNAFGDLVYKVLFDGPMGRWIMTAIIKICEFLNWVYNNIVQPLICWARAAILFVLDPIGMGFVNVLNGISFGKLGYLRDNIQDAKKSVKQSLTCNNRNPLDCNITFRSDPSAITTLPLATRCWAGAEPGINSFACTAADTCLNEDFSKVICGACPKTSSMIHFGCNTLTKLCSCNIFPQDTSYCSSHEECTMEGGAIECEFVDSYLEPSYGHTPCRQCPKPICLITDGSGRGKCSCLLRPIPNQGCVGFGERVSPSASSLCLIATTGSGQGASSTYTQTYRTLASVPCMLINQATSYCMQVYTSATASAPMVVGLSLLKTFRRRLLQFENGTAAFHFTSNTSAWEGSSEPCKSLIATDVSELGVLEKYTLAECWRWRDVGSRIIAEANMSGVKSTFLVSWQDLLDAMLDEGAVPEILSKLPGIVHGILLHTEAAQPIYITLLYWSSYLPLDTWSNQTVLNQAKLYLINLTHSDSPGRRLFSVDSPRVIGEWHDGPYHGMPHQIYWNLPSERKRRLMTTQQVQGADSTINAIPSAETVYDWSQGPYSWPPNFNYWQGKDSCAVVSTAIKVVKNGLDVTMQFYQSTPPDPKPVSWPGLPLNDNVDIHFSLPDSTDVGVIIRQYTDQVFNKTYVEDFLDNAPYASSIKSLIQCNFTRIQTCQDRYDLVSSTLQVIVVSLVIGVIGRLLEIPYLETILILFFVPLVMYTAYGYALTCAPLIPVCALRDLLALLDLFLPESIVWPTALVSTPGCTDVSCIRSCTDDMDIGFASWQDHLAWIMCETDSKWCNKIANSLASNDPLKTAIRHKYFEGMDPSSTRAARRICFVATIANSMPSLMAVLLLLFLLPSAVGACVCGIQFASNTLISFVIFVHGDG